MLHDDIMTNMCIRTYVNLLHDRRRKPPTCFGQGGVFRKLYYSTVMQAGATPQHYFDGDTMHTARKLPSLTQFSTNDFISILYFNIYFETYT